MMVKKNNSFAKWLKVFGLTFSVVFGFTLLFANGANAQLLNTSNSSATPYLSYGAYFPTESQLSSKNIVSTEKNLPTKLYYGKTYPGSKAGTAAYYDTTKEASPFVIYSSNSSLDKSAKVNPAKLTGDQSLELARYGLKLINQYRKLMGRKPLKITYRMMKLQASYIQWRVKHNADIHEMTQYDKMYTKEFNSNHTVGSWMDAENISFDYNGFQLGTPTTTMLSLKVSVYNGISQMMFCDGGDNNWGHRTTFLYKTYTEIAMGVQYYYGKRSGRNSAIVWNLGSINDGSKNLTSVGSYSKVATAVKTHSYRASFIKKINRLDLSKGAKKSYARKINRTSSTKTMNSIYNSAKRAAKKYLSSMKKKTVRAINKLHFKKNKKAKKSYVRKARAAKKTSQLKSILKAARKAASKR